jgi:hypothetical protein
MSRSRVDTGQDSEKSSSIDYHINEYIKNNIPETQIRSIMANRGKTQDQIEKVIEKVSEKRERISRAASKFLEKIQQRYNEISPSTVTQLANSTAEKYNFSGAEKNIFMHMITNREKMNELFSIPQKFSNGMTRLFNVQYMGGYGAPPSLNVQSDEYSYLEKINKLYEEHIDLQQNVVNQHLRYNDLDIQALSGTYDRTTNAIGFYIHPVLAALFLPKIDLIERRMLRANLGRIMVERSRAYLNTSHPVKENSIVNSEVDDYKFVLDMISDPTNSRSLDKESPVQNILKRFNIQIELWKNISKLRNGNYYGTLSSGSYNEITRLNNLVNNYRWYLFDSPDVSQPHDEGLFLKKLLSIFSLRPTYCQTTTVGMPQYMTSNYIMPQVGRVKLESIPVINVKIERENRYPAGAEPSLKDMLNYMEWFPDEYHCVPKNKTVIFSDEVLFVNVHRREQIPNQYNITINYPNLPKDLLDARKSNIITTPVYVPRQMDINRQNFNLRSIVTVDPPISKEQVSTTSSTILVRRTGSNMAATEEFIYYHPIGPAQAFLKQKSSGGDEVTRNDPMTMIPHDDATGEVTFTNLSKRYGSIYVYVNEEKQMENKGSYTNLQFL